MLFVHLSFNQRVVYIKDVHKCVLQEQNNCKKEYIPYILILVVYRDIVVGSI